MKSLGHLLGAGSRPASSQSLNADEEAAALEHAMSAAVLILNDDIDTAEERLAKGTSAFHKLGTATAAFLRAALGLEQDMMKEAAGLLSEAQDAASESQRRAYTQGFRSAIYPPGTEYALCYAESQIMAAVLGVLNESLSESVKAFYRLRKAYATLQGIFEAERKYLASRPSTSKGSSALPSGAATPPSFSSTREPSAAASKVSLPADPDAEDGVHEYTDAKDVAPQTTDGEELVAPLSSIAIVPTEETDLFLQASDHHPIDSFIHSGTALCFGILQLLLSLIPPTFSRLLSIVGFRGDKVQGLRLLWSAAQHADNINGGFAALVLLGYYANLVNFCDVLTPDAFPRARCRALLQTMRARYPRSRLWMMEEARMLAGERRLEDAVALMVADKTVAPLRQIEALKWFELSIEYMFLGEWEKCAEGFIKCIDLNNWSRGLYLYIAATAYLELSFTLPPDSAAKSRARATALLSELPSHLNTRRIFARPLPFDAYVARKLAKWTAAAGGSSDPAALVAVAAPSCPIEEMVYFWGGLKRRDEAGLRAGLGRVERAGAGRRAVDEDMVRRVLGAAARHRLGEGGAREALEEVARTEWAGYKAAGGANGEGWAVPVGCYELAVVEWDLYRGGGDGAAEALGRCGALIERVARWEAYDLNGRIGIKVRAAQETLRAVEAQGAAVS